MADDEASLARYTIGPPILVQLNDLGHPGFWINLRGKRTWFPVEEDPRIFDLSECALTRVGGTSWLIFERTRHRVEREDVLQALEKRVHKRLALNKQVLSALELGMTIGRGLGTVHVRTETGVIKLP